MITTTAGALVVYSGTGLYILFIILSFVYPTLKVNRTAQSLREEHLDEYRARIRSLEDEISAIEVESESTLKEISLRMEIERVRREFQNYKNVRLYPLSIGIFVRLASSILLPIGFTLLDFFLPRFL
jgi:hypothetical protein